jgi:hypothetical protein
MRETVAPSGPSRNAQKNFGTKKLESRAGELGARRRRLNFSPSSWRWGLPQARETLRPRVSPILWI